MEEFVLSCNVCRLTKPSVSSSCLQLSRIIDGEVVRRSLGMFSLCEKCYYGILCSSDNLPAIEWMRKLPFEKKNRPMGG